MVNPGLGEAGTLLTQLGRIRKRHTLSSPRNLSSKFGRGSVLFLVTLVCSLILATRLLWCFMYLFTGTATEVYVEPRGGRNDIIFEETKGLRAKGDESVVRVWDGKANNEDLEENRVESELLESKNTVETEDDKEERKLDEDDGDKKAEIEEVWSDDKEILNQMAEMANSEEEDVTRDEAEIDEGAAVTRKMPDAMAYLEQLAGKLAKTGDHEENGPYHSRRIFESDYAEMKRKLKIFIYPHDHNDPFHLIFEPRKRVPSGNYASEEFFQQALMSSGFVTKDASEADFFFMPISITKARLDKRIDVRGLQNFCANYVTAVRTQWNYWNRSSGADHFYLSCHSVARNAMDQVPVVKQNVIQLLCPASYFLASYITHKDASVPQIWPREGAEPKEVRLIAQRKRLAFFAGALNSPVRQELERTWSSDDKIMVHKGRVPYPYSEALLTSKFCLHAKGFEVNTARLGDAMYYGCVPVVIANHYDLPFQDILDWTKFSIVISSLDIPLLKRTLEAVTDEQYAELHSQVLKTRKHFQWHNPAQEYDAFHTVMYELWKRRHIVKRSSYPNFALNLYPLVGTKRLKLEAAEIGGSAAFGLNFDRTASSTNCIPQNLDDLEIRQQAIIVHCIAMGAYGGMAKNLFEGANVAFEDPKVAADLYAYRPPWMEEIKKIDRHNDRAGGVSFQEGRGTRRFFDTGSSVEGKMAAEQYFNRTRPHQGSLRTLGAPKSINTRYADVIRNHLNKWG